MVVLQLSNNVDMRKLGIMLEKLRSVILKQEKCFDVIYHFLE